MIQNKALAFLGIAQKAKKIVSGEFSVEKAVKEGKAYGVIIATDASDNTKKMFQNMCDFYQIKIYFFSTKEELGLAIGKRYRASIAILDANMAEALFKKISDSTIE